jgi:hypothetical protein
VGIGTSSPALPLDVGATSNKSIGVKSATSNYAYLGTFNDNAILGVNRNPATGNSADVNKASSAIALFSGNADSRIVFETTATNGGLPSERMRIKGDGNVGIGTTTMYRTGLNVVSGGTGGQIAIRHPNQTGSRHWYIGVEGSNDVVNFYADNSQGVYMSRGDTAWSANSDERLKTDLIPITDALNKLNTLRTVTGRYKKDEVGKSRSFLLAQDVLKVFPEAVDIKDDEDKTLGLRYSELVPLLIKGIQELKSELDELKAKVG